MEQLRQHKAHEKKLKENFMVREHPFRLKRKDNIIKEVKKNLKLQKRNRKQHN